MNSHLILFHFTLFQHLFWSAVSEGADGGQKTQFTPLQCNNIAICASSPPSNFLYSVRSVTTCATQCYFRQYQQAPCVGFNYRETNNSCDFYTDNPRFFDNKEVGCQFYQNGLNANWNCSKLPGLQAATLVASLNGNANEVATALLDEQLFITRYFVPSVAVYNTTSFSLLRTISYSGFGTWLFGLATSPINNYLYISDYLGQRVHRVDLSMPSTVSVITWNVPGYPKGLSTTSNGNLLAAISRTSLVDSVGIISEYAPNGPLVRIISNNIYSWQAVEVNKDVLAFTVTSPQAGLCTMWKNGTTIKCFGSSSGSAVTQMNYPRSFVIDTLGYYIITDRNNNRVVMVDPTLTDARQLQLPLVSPLTFPNAMSLDQSRGRLYVGEDGGRQRVLVFDGVW